LIHVGYNLTSVLQDQTPQTRLKLLLTSDVRRYVTIRMLVMENKIGEAIDMYRQIFKEVDDRLVNKGTEIWDYVENLWRMVR
jgi:hypothetical protein